MNNNAETIKALAAELSALQEQIKPLQEAAAARFAALQPQTPPGLSQYAPTLAALQEQIKPIQEATAAGVAVIQSKIKPLQDFAEQMQGRAALLIEQMPGATLAAELSALQEQITPLCKAAANCLELSAGPQSIRPQIAYFAQIAKAQFTAFDTETIQKAAAGITAYYEAHRAEIAEFEQEAAARLAAEQEAETAKATARKEAAARLAAEQEARRYISELEKTRAELALYRAAVDLQKILQEAAGPQPGNPATLSKQPAPIQPRADFSPEITPAEISAIFDGLPQDFRPTKAQFSALFGRPVTMPAPIETTPGRAAALLSALYAAGFIQTAKYATIATARQCFKYNGRIITAKQLRDAKEANKTAYTPADFDYIKALNQ